MLDLLGKINQVKETIKTFQLHPELKSYSLWDWSLHIDDDNTEVTGKMKVNDYEFESDYEWYLDSQPNSPNLPEWLTEDLWSELYCDLRDEAKQDNDGLPIIITEEKLTTLLLEARNLLNEDLCQTT